MSDQRQIIIPREHLHSEKIDIGGRTLVTAFNEPKFRNPKYIQSHELDSKLNARLATYFLPAVELSRMQKKRSRLMIVSGINMALLWNAKNDEERKIMLANNSIKIDFLKQFFETFFSEDFSLVEFVVSQDPLKVSHDKFLALWNTIEKKYPEELKQVRFQLTKFLHPKKFNVASYADLDEERIKEMNNTDITQAVKYAITHLFVFADINFKGNYIHNPNGYASFGGKNEEFFNIVRELAFTISKEYGELIFDQEIEAFDNIKIVLEHEYKQPPPYNGSYTKEQLNEVTFENERSLDYYDNIKGLSAEMNYMYEHILPKAAYEQFWNAYRDRYLQLKSRYREAYEISHNW